MTLTDLIPNESDFGSELPFMASVLEQYNGEFTPVDDVTGMFAAAARADLQLSLPRYVGEALDWYGYNASIATTEHLPAWRYLVSRRQLSLLYAWLDEGEGSLNRQKLKQYEREWREALGGIRSTINGSGGIAVTRTIRVGL